MKGHRGAVVFVLALTLTALAASCSSNNGGSPGQSSSAPASETTSGGGGGGGGTTITAQNFAFHPDAVTVPAGTVTLTVVNKDSVEHTFTLDDGSSSTNLQPGTTETITLDLSKTVGWHCNIHPSMTGTLTVG